MSRSCRSFSANSAAKPNSVIFRTSALEMNSPLKMMLNFGNIIVQTAAGEGAFTFDHVPNPRNVREEITRPDDGVAAGG